MDAHKYDEGPSPHTEDYVTEEAKRLGITVEKAWELYHAYYDKGYDGLPFSDMEPDDFLDGDEVELVQPFTSSTVYGVLK